MEEIIVGLMIKPGEHPQKVVLEPGLKHLQEAVGGYIEVVYPYKDKVGIICNEEGKLDGLPLNRALRDPKTGEITDIIAGNMLIVGLTEDDFGSLTGEQLIKYEALFHQPECFVKMGRNIMAVPMTEEMLGSKGSKACKDIEREIMKTTGAPVL